MTTECYGYYTLGETARVLTETEARMKVVLAQTEKDAKMVVEAMAELVKLGLPESTVVWVYGQRINVTDKTMIKNTPELVVQVVTEATGKLKKSRSSEEDAVEYKGTMPTGVRVDFVAVPPGCRVEEREETIPAVEEHIVKKRVLICSGPDGTTEEIIE